MLHRWATIIAASLFALFLGMGAAQATSCTIPNIFVNDTVADADTVNADFTAILGCINANVVIQSNSIQNLVIQPSGRLTFQSGIPVMNGAVGPVGTIFFTPYMGSMVSLWDGTNWNAFKFSELSNVLANSAVGKAGPAATAANSCYDLFVWNAGTPTSPTLTLTRGPAFTTCSNVGGSAARAAAGGISTQDGLRWTPIVGQPEPSPKV